MVKFQARRKALATAELLVTLQATAQIIARALQLIAHRQIICGNH